MSAKPTRRFFLFAIALVCACGGTTSTAPQGSTPPPGSTTPPPPAPPPPTFPAGLHATRFQGVVILDWNPTDGATTYDVTVSGTLGGKIVTQDLGNTNATEFEIDLTPQGDAAPSATFSVQAIGPALTNPRSSVEVPAPPVLTLASVSHHRVALTWPFNPLSGHAAVVQQSSRGASPVDIGQSFTESYQDLTFTDGVRYTYTVKVSTAQLDVFSTSVTAKVPSAAPTDVAAAADPDGVRLSWTNSEGQASAQVLTSLTAGGPYTLMGEVNPPFVAGCAFATTCFYVVTSVDLDHETGGTSSEISGRRIPSAPAPTAHSLIGSVRIDWPDRPPDAQSFIVSRSTASISGPFEEVGRTTDLTFTDTTGIPWTPYWYEVQSTNGQSISLGAATNAARSTESPDQQSLLSGLHILDTTLHDVGQSVTAGTSGQLMAIEFSGDYAQSFPIGLSIFDGDTLLASNVAPWVHVFPNFGGALVPDEVLGIYYDLSPFGISVSAGQTLRFEAVSVGAGAFSQAFVGIANGDAYAGGTVFLDGASDSTKDLLFKTFVRRGSDLTAPAPLKATAGTESIALRWPASPGSVEYRIGRSDAAGGTKTIVQVTKQTSFVDPGLVPGTTHFYQVTAAGPDGSTASSEETSAEVLPMVVDQSNLADQPDATSIKLFLDTVSGTQQSATLLVTAGKTGALAGLELAALGLPALRLGIFDDQSGTQLGTADYPLPVFGERTPHPLSATRIGPTYLDLTPLGLHISAGDRLRFEIAIAPVPVTGIPPFCFLREDAAGSLAFKTFIQ